MGMKQMIAGALCAITVGGFATGAFAEDAKTLRLGYATAQDGPGGVAAAAMAERLAEVSGGALKIEFFPGAQLGGEVEMLAQVRSGTLDMALLSTPSISAIEPAIAVVDLPYIWKSSANHWAVLNGPVGDELLDKLESKGLKGLAWGSWGARGLITNGLEIRMPADLDGKRVRIIQSEFFVRMVEALHAHPAPIAWTEVYTALQQKAVDAVDVTYWAIPEASLDEVGTSLALTSHVIASSVFLINKSTFDRLSDDEKAWLTEASVAGGKAKYEMIDKATNDAIEAMRAQGLTVTEPDLEAFAAAVKPVFDYYIDTFGEEGKTLVEKVQSAQE